MPHFQHVQKTDLAVGTMDIEILAPYISALEQYYGAPDSGALVLQLGDDETKREETKRLRQAFKVLQARNGNSLPDNALVVKTRGSKLAVSIETSPPPKVSRPRKAKATA